MATAYRPPARHNTYHGAKRAILGNQSGMPAPAWKSQNIPLKAQVQRTQASSKSLPGSKILLSNLPKDVGQDEVEELFRKTIGPVTDAFVVYNSQGNSKGIAVVTFARPADAGAARSKYHGKIVDGRTPITIEIITNDDPRPNSVPPAPAPAPTSLMARLGPAVTGKGVISNGPILNGARGKPVQSLPLTSRVGPPPNAPKGPKPKAAAKAPAPAPAAAPPVSAKRARTKKGPKRVHKIVRKTANQLDQEMEDYRAAIGTSKEVDAAMAG